MSKEIIEAVFRHSHKYGKQLMLICSRNQVDVNTGYVFTTPQYMIYIAKMKHKYPQADVLICRDHCGPGFGISNRFDIPNNNLESVKDTIRCDLEHGFDLIHIDLCHAFMPHLEKLRNTTKLMELALDIKPDIMFEIGTDENIGEAETNVDRIISDIRTCQQVANPIFYVIQTGSLVYEAHNAGSFDIDKVGVMHDVLANCNVKLKEHNADYLTSQKITKRKGIVDAVNIAPQLGVVQTSHVLSKALLYGLNIQPFTNEVACGGNWSKWSDQKNSQVNHYRLWTLIAGHYHFNGPAYQQLIAELSCKMNIEESIIGEITKVIEHYLFALE
jgi:hypothetical protein